MSPRPAPEVAPKRWKRRAVEIGVFVGVIALLMAWQTRDLLGDGAQAPAFDLPTLDGGRVSSADLSGKRVLLHFWATWCEVCRMETGALEAVARDAPSGTEVITIAADDDVEVVRRFARERGLGYRIALADAAVLRAYRVHAFPTNYYLDREGRVRGATVGLSNRWAMRARLWMAR